MKYSLILIIFLTGCSNQHYIRPTAAITLGINYPMFRSPIHYSGHINTLPRYNKHDKYYSKKYKYFQKHRRNKHKNNKKRYHKHYNNRRPRY